MKKRNLIATRVRCGRAGLRHGACGLRRKTPHPAEQIKADIAEQFDPVKNLDQTAVDELTSELEAANEFQTYGIDSAA